MENGYEFVVSILEGLAEQTVAVQQAIAGHPGINREPGVKEPTSPAGHAPRVNCRAPPVDSPRGPEGVVTAFNSWCACPYGERC